jgi:DNA-binding IclR family transcriptional regulator
MRVSGGSRASVTIMFSVELPEWGVTQVAGELGLSKSKAREQLASLSTVGLVRRTDRGRYWLCWRVAGMGRVLSDTTEFHSEARPVLDVLRARFQETVQLAALEAAASSTSIACRAAMALAPRRCRSLGPGELDNVRKGAAGRTGGRPARGRRRIY